MSAAEIARELWEGAAHLRDGDTAAATQFWEWIASTARRIPLASIRAVLEGSSGMDRDLRRLATFLAHLLQHAAANVQIDREVAAFVADATTCVCVNCEISRSPIDALLCRSDFVQALHTFSRADCQACWRMILRGHEDKQRTAEVARSIGKCLSIAMDSGLTFVGDSAAAAIIDCGLVRNC